MANLLAKVSVIPQNVLVVADHDAEIIRLRGMLAVSVCRAPSHAIEGGRVAVPASQGCPPAPQRLRLTPK